MQSFGNIMAAIIVGDFNLLSEAIFYAIDE